MIKMAFFVEGETEQLFVEWLVREIVGSAHLKIEKRSARGGVSTRRRTRIVEADRDFPEAKYYFLIVDCSGDGGVKSRIREEYQNLVRSGYSSIVALRDAPKSRHDIAKIRERFSEGLPASPVTIELIVAIMEIEAWFLAEHTHLCKIDPQLSAERIRSNLGFDPSADDMRLRDRPASDLDACYQLVGLTYRKGRASQRTIYNLDVHRIVFDLAPNDRDIHRLVAAIEHSLSRT